jgi:diaminohydroxyphosphoribosylaminopyrimidine deaminase/5-amino-6-(5-phosphoribosylamino)uracil reductase
MHDEQYMRRAIELASRGSGYVSPNPMVGAVLVYQDRIIGEGWHAVYGDVHAEVACLNSVAEADWPLISQSTMYVTLEPCAHQGKQPPCANRLVQEGIRKVVIAVEDPFPQVSGRGVSILQQAGIEVAIGCLRQEARWMARRFLSMQEQGRPYIVLKWAQSADGYLAPADGSRQQLSDQFSQTLVHKWRTEESAILVGYNTALADNPRLDARLWQGPQPLRLALDRELRLPNSHHLLDASVPTWIVNEQADAAGPTTFLKLPFNETLFPALLQRLGQAGKNSLFVEGGAQVLNSFITAGLWDEARAFFTPKVLGSGIPAPLLNSAALASDTQIGTDAMRLYSRATNPYQYPSGAIL